MWPYPWTHVGTPSHLGHMDRVAATMPSQAHAGAAQEAPNIGQWEGQDVPLVRPSSCNVKGGIPSSRRYLPTWVEALLKMFLSELFHRTDAVLLCNDDLIVGWRRKKGFKSMHMKHHRCDQVTYLVIAMHSRSRAPEVNWP